MPRKENPLGARVFSENDHESCRIETQGGTVYWLSKADKDGPLDYDQLKLHVADT